MFRMGKPESDPQEVDGIFFMMRIRESALERTLKSLLPRIYTAPRSEGGQPDHAYRIVWVPDKTPRDLRTIAATMKGSCLGLRNPNLVVESESDVPILSQQSRHCSQNGRLRSQH